MRSEGLKESNRAESVLPQDKQRGMGGIIRYCVPAMKADTES